MVAFVSDEDFEILSPHILDVRRTTKIVMHRVSIIDLLMTSWGIVDSTAICVTEKSRMNNVQRKNWELADYTIFLDSTLLKNIP